MVQHLNLVLELYGFYLILVTKTQLKKVWTHLKNNVKQRNTTFKQNNVQSLFFEPYKLYTENKMIVWIWTA